MKICDLATSAGRLNKSLADLKEKWSETKEYWNDSSTREFQEEHLQPLTPQIQLAIAAINRLAEVLVKVERDCEDPDRTS